MLTTVPTGFRVYTQDGPLTLSECACHEHLFWQADGTAPVCDDCWPDENDESQWVRP